MNGMVAAVKLGFSSFSIEVAKSFYTSFVAFNNRVRYYRVQEVGTLTDLEQRSEEALDSENPEAAEKRKKKREEVDDLDQILQAKPADFAMPTSVQDALKVRVWFALCLYLCV